jgi:hypothetical protein
VDSQPQAGSNCLPFHAGGYGLCLDINRLPQPSEPSLAYLTFVRHVRRDDDFSSIGKRKNAVIQGTLSNGISSAPIKKKREPV